MEKTFQTVLSLLNKEWKEFIEEQKFYILSKSNDIVVEILLNLNFGKPSQKTEDFDISNGNTETNITLTGYEIEVHYTGDTQLIESPNFLMGIHELYDYTSYPFSNWLINASWYSADDTKGSEFELYFWDLGLEDGNEKIFQEMFKLFKLKDKIEYLYLIHFQEEKEAEYQKFVEKYDGTTIKIIKKGRIGYIQLEDGLEIPIP